MKLFLDTEFTGLHQNTDLISIGFNNGISQPTVLCEFNASDIEENTFEINDYPWTKGGDHDN